VALVNNVAAAHLERMGSLLGVAETKGAIYDALPAAGTAVINADDAFAEYFAEKVADRRILRYGLESSADVTATHIQADADGSRFTLVTPQGEIAVDLHLPGRHNILNALAAASLALACDVSLRMIAEGLAAAIDTLAAGAGEAWLVLGDMRELGADAIALHADAGRRARAAGITRLYTLGPLSQAATAAFGDGAHHFDTHKILADALRADLHAGVRCLVKGSRGSAMDKIVTALLSEGEGKPHVA
jgi:UDP-N-acetylmuramoyl-tripeptide--D-alanyl-D-alanine ligase